MPNPILVELTRGTRVESVHSGAIAIVRPGGEIVASLGNVEASVFPRSAIKPLQALPLLETGAADRFGFAAREIALACASHSGTPRHAATAADMLSRAGLAASALACGVHEPLDAAVARDLAKAGHSPTALNHNCSGKHAGMLATAVHKDEVVADYWHVDHPVQVRIARLLEDMTGRSLGTDLCGIDGCSVPNWAIPLSNLAVAFARFASGERLAPDRARACLRIAQACWAEPEFVAGRGRLDTLVLEALPGKALTKTGAEGVHCGAFPEQELGFALKIDDGAKRAADLIVAALVSRLYPESGEIGRKRSLRNARGLVVGEVRISAKLSQLLDGLL